MKVKAKYLEETIKLLTYAMKIKENTFNFQVKVVNWCKAASYFVYSCQKKAITVACSALWPELPIFSKNNKPIL